MKIADLRIDYSLKSLDISDVLPSPVAQFKIWLDEAIQAKVMEVNAMNLATIRSDGGPNSRIVLLKEIDDGFVFYTNYSSIKGKEMEANPLVSLTFFWGELERQVRVAGKVEKVSSQESDEYFLSRPFLSQIGAWVSPQSQVIGDRTLLEKKVQEFQEKFKSENIVRPEHWGGYRVMPYEVEFWQGRPSRLHDRILYKLDSENKWNIERLAP